MTQIRIKDKRSGRFIVDDVILNGYGKQLGSTGITFYIILCRYANNKTQQCWPSLRTIKKRTGMAFDTILSSAEKCIKLGLIKKKVVKGKYTLYTLFEPSAPKSERVLQKGYTSAPKSERGAPKRIHKRTKINELRKRTKRESPKKKSQIKKGMTFKEFSNLSGDTLKAVVPEKYLGITWQSQHERAVNWVESKGKQQGYKDFKAFFRNWLMNSAEFKKERGGEYRSVKTR